MYINENFKQKYLKYKKKYYKLKKGGEWNTKEREEWNRLYPCTPSQTDLKSKLDELKKDKEYEEQYERYKKNNSCIQSNSKYEEKEDTPWFPPLKRAVTQWRDASQKAFMDAKQEWLRDIYIYSSDEEDEEDEEEEEDEEDKENEKYEDDFEEDDEEEYEVDFEDDENININSDSDYCSDEEPLKDLVNISYEDVIKIKNKEYIPIEECTKKIKELQKNKFKK